MEILNLFNDLMNGLVNETGIGEPIKIITLNKTAFKILYIKILAEYKDTHMPQGIEDINSLEQFRLLGIMIKKEKE